MHYQKPTRRHKNAQEGAVAIEFALIFPVLFAVAYSIIAYGMAFTLIQSFTYAAEDALRASLAAECAESICTEAELAAEVAIQVTGSLNWLSTSIVNTAVSGANFFTCDVDRICTVELRAPPILSGLTLPIIGNVPPMPAELVGRASLLM